MGRFFRRGYSKILFSPDNLTAATIDNAAMTAAIDLSDDIADINGFELTNSPIPTPNLGTAFTPQIEGEDTVSDSGFVFYDDDVDDEIRTALAKGTGGTILLAPYGTAAGSRLELWPIKSNGINDRWTTGNDAAQTAAQLSVTGVPEQDAEVPAAA